MHNRLIMKYPSSWHGEMWREAAPFGNGLVGGMVYGGICKERILLNHAFLWRGGRTEALPDVSASLAEVRRLLNGRKVAEADRVLSEAIRESGYLGDTMIPSCLCDLVLERVPVGIFSKYRRIVHMDRAEVTVSWREGGTCYERSVFASRKNHLVFMHYTCEKGRIDTTVAFQVHDTETLHEVELPVVSTFHKEDCLYYSGHNDGAFYPGDYGAVSRIFTDGELSFTDEGARIRNASRILIVTGLFVGRKKEKAFQELEEALGQSFDYQEELEKHTAIHKPLFETAELSLTEKGEEHSNEELLLDAYEEEASPELMEKLYAFGRYLFLCATSDQGSLPCHLTGLYNGDYQGVWAIYMYNINFQMIYWHTLSGNLPSFLRAALDYTESFVPDFRENARKIFGCRGIFINSVNTPESGLCKCLANHIVNWTGGAAWIARHFWDYYRYTLDLDYLKEHALPFMYEAALFYEDFAVEADDGYYTLYPSVSPENVAGNIRESTPPEINVEISVDATMEIALMKELLTNLLEGARITGMYREKQETWHKMLAKIRPYRVNEEGALSEWADEFYKDNYRHRHHSHLYPVFPGEEITKGHPLYPAAERAEDLRLSHGLFDQSAWSLLMMAGIAAHMERGELAFQLLSTLSRTCLMNNFLSVHNDWRRMGPACCDDMRYAPFQIDGNIGIPGIVHEMLVQSSEQEILVLPALPQAWKQGAVKGLLLMGAVKCDIVWKEGVLTVTLDSEQAIVRRLRLSAGYRFADGSKEREITVKGRMSIIAERERS